MADAYQAVRSIPFASLAPALGIDLSTFKSRQKGQEVYGRCPLHEAKSNTTSFSWHSDGRFHCFSCEAKGKGAIDFLQQYRRIGFKEAVAWLKAIQSEQLSDSKKSPVTGDSTASKDNANVSNPAGGAVETENDEAPLTPFKGSYAKFAVPCPWLEQRVPDAGVRTRYGVFCYDNPTRKSKYSGRAMLPFRTIDATLYGYMGRDTSGAPEVPKYLIPPGFPKSRFLFGSDVLKAGTFGQVPLKRIWLVESPFAVMKFASVSVPALSPFGWSISDEQILVLQGLTRGIVYLPDRNKTVERESIAGKLATVPFWVRCPELPPGIDDPEHLTREQILAL